MPVFSATSFFFGSPPKMPFFPKGTELRRPRRRFGLATKRLRETDLPERCDLLGFATQERFLVNCGIAELLAEKQRTAGDADYAVAASGAHKILAPHEMGEIVKFIAWGRGVSPPLRGFATEDIRHKL